jgi:ATP-dependent RNA helicase DDX54/DBP10
MPTPVQRKTIPVLMSGKDAIVCYKTGSGKTLAYLLPMINKLKCHSTLSGARGLILVPTKDLAEQIASVLKTYLKGRNMIDLRYSLILGGHTYEGQFNSLATNPDIIIATPGRLMELVVDTDLRLGRVEMIVFDEADQLFENSSLTAQLKEILQKCPMSQRLMFSATINENLNDFAKSCLKEYSYIHQEIALPETMTLDAFIVRSGDKIGALLYILEKMLPNEKVIVFASTRFHVDYLVALIGMVTECFGIYGKMDVDQRSYALDNFRKKKGSVVLVVTDVAARGLDIPFVKYVIHYDYPTNHKTFVHRSGRTARKN